MTFKVKVTTKGENILSRLKNVPQEQRKLIFPDGSKAWPFPTNQRSLLVIIKGKSLLWPLFPFYCESLRTVLCVFPGICTSGVAARFTAVHIFSHFLRENCWLKDDLNPGLKHSLQLTCLTGWGPSDLSG